MDKKVKITIDKHDFCAILNINDEQFIVCLVGAKTDL
jgi:hypothetical protein